MKIECSNKNLTADVDRRFDLHEISVVACLVILSYSSDKGMKICYVRLYVFSTV